MKNLLYIIVFLTSPTALAAQNPSNSVKVAQAERPSDLDSIIVDAKLRTQSGSKSKWSSSFRFNYQGASLRKPMDEIRPNVGGDLKPRQVKASGDVGIRYRLKPQESLYLATGYTRVRPFHNRESDDTELSSPRLMWNMTDRFNDIQASSNLMAMYFTSDYETSTGSRSMLTYDVSAIANPNQSRFDAGISIGAFYKYHDLDSSMLQQRQSDYGFSFTPMVQYRVSDNVKLFTSVGLFSFYHLRSDPAWAYTKSVVSQTVGAGFAIRRDFYLSPSIEFRPSNMRSDLTAVNLSATANVF